MLTQFAPLLDELVTSTARLAVSVMGSAPDALRAHLLETLSQPAGTAGSLLAEPVFEPKHSYKAAPENMDELSKRDLLHPNVISALSQPPIHFKSEAFPSDRKPYAHQLECWEWLNSEKPKSVLVSSGTGSGKTECFLVPILDSLTRSAASGELDPGIRAIFLYPLNALISNQKKRLAAWTHGLPKEVRYALYSGSTPEMSGRGIKAADLKKELSDFPKQVHTRQEIRSSPPPLLITNGTMLEYLLVRPADRPILQQSQGKLKYIVIDEAHTYLGSQAAELAMLLRRVMHAFGVKPGDVSLIATSATIGDPATAGPALKDFVANLAGGINQQVKVIFGQTDIPELPPLGDSTSFNSLEDMAEEPRHAHLAATPAYQEFFKAINEQKGLGLTAINQVFSSHGMSVNRQQTLRLLDWISDKSTHSGTALLPLRLHQQCRTQGGIWACINPGCPGKTAHLNQPDWPFGSVHSVPLNSCPHCQSMVLQAMTCDNCGHPFLLGAETGNGKLQPTFSLPPENDEFAASDTDTDPKSTSDDEMVYGPTRRRLLTRAKGTAVPVPSCWYHRQDGRICQAVTDGAVNYEVITEEKGECPHCAVHLEIRPPEKHLCHLSVGRPVLMANVTQIVSRRSGEGNDPGKLITFADSRQGVARLASSMQRDFERTYIRSLLYHTCLAQRLPGLNAAEEQKLQEYKADLSKAPSSVKHLIEQEIAQLEQKKTGGYNTISWREAVQIIADDETFRDYLLPFWAAFATNQLDTRNPQIVAALLLYRELLRRAKNSNNLESMGLINIGFPALRKAVSLVPAPLALRHWSTSAWQDFLEFLLNYMIRGTENTLALPQELRGYVFQQFINPNVKTNFLLPPGQQPENPNQRKWPLAIKQGAPRLLVMLNQAIIREGKKPLDDGELAEVMSFAWQQLSQCGDTQNRQLFINPDRNGFTLNMDLAHISPLTQAWLCPATNKIQSGVLGGKSYYASNGPDAVPISIPQPPVNLHLRSADIQERRQQLRVWLNTDPIIKQARQKGWWLGIHDAALLAESPLRTVEHSAQIDRPTLESYEKAFQISDAQFRASKTQPHPSEPPIHILNCSTTMEMGVDIGGIGAVGLYNPPPTSANYLQRVGRAGRRLETKAFAYTICPDTPLGHASFQRPDWPLRTAQLPPRVELESSILIERHINAFLLTRFFSQTEVSANALDLTTLSFFQEKLGLVWQFIKWCDSSKTHTSLQTDLAQLSAGTALTNISPSELCKTSHEKVNKIAREWETIRAILEEQKQVAGSNNAASASLERLLKQHTGAFLLTYLTEQGFLPGHGFPTNICSFAYPGKSFDKASRFNENDRSYPSRGIIQALTEYAPGNDVVIDGAVYKVDGVAINWRRPSTQGEVDHLLLYHWTCQQCDHSGNSMTLVGKCPNQACGSDQIKAERYLQPRGFTADLNHTPRFNTNQVDQVPSPEVNVQLNTPWKSEHPRGRIRSDLSGSLFFCSKGTHGQGYEICLHCGTSKARKRGDTSTFRTNHPPLNLQKKAGSRGLCPGTQSPWAVQDVALGYNMPANLYEWEPSHPIKGNLSATTPQDMDIATTLAVALRTVAAQHLGILTNEIGFHIYSAPDSNKRESLRVSLYDQAAGGAGFVNQLMPDWGSLLAEVEKHLKNCTCSSACTACLLQSDTQKHYEHLNRHSAVHWFET